MAVSPKTSGFCALTPMKPTTADAVVSQDQGQKGTKGKYPPFKPPSILRRHAVRQFWAQFLGDLRGIDLSPAGATLPSQMCSTPTMRAPLFCIKWAPYALVPTRSRGAPRETRG